MAQTKKIMDPPAGELAFLRTFAEWLAAHECAVPLAERPAAIDRVAADIQKTFGMDVDLAKVWAGMIVRAQRGRRAKTLSLTPPPPGPQSLSEPAAAIVGGTASWDSGNRLALVARLGGGKPSSTG